MRPHTTEGEDRPRGVTSRDTGRWSRIAILALGLLGACDSKPAPSTPAAARALSAGERATLVAASRAIAAGENPFVSGLDPERTIALRALADAIESGRAGARWPTFRADAGTAGYLNSLKVQTLLLDGSEQSKRNAADLESRLQPLVAALDAGDLASARRAHDRWRSAFDSFPSK